MKGLVIAVCVAGFALTPAALEAQVSVGGQGSWGDRRDWAVGGRVTVDLSPSAVPVALIGAYDWFFPDVPSGIDADYWEINVNVVFVQSVSRAAPASYLGVGLNVADFKAEGEFAGQPIPPEDYTRYGINLVGGTRYKFGRLAPFFELRYIIEGGRQFVISAGLDLLLTSGY